MKRFLFACLFPASILQLPAEVREFKNNKGQIIKAEPVKMRGTNVLLRMENKQQVPVPLKNFSGEDQVWLRNWMTWDPMALDYNLLCKPVEKAGEAARQKFTYFRYEAVPRGYEVQITNGGQTAIDGVKVSYRIFMEDRVDETGNTQLKASFHSGTAELPLLKYNGTHTLVTKKLKCEKLSPVDGWTFYVGKVTRDRLRGVWLRFHRHGVMVNEYKSQGVPKCEWPENKAETRELEEDKAAAAKGAEKAANAAMLPATAEPPVKPEVHPPASAKPKTPKVEDPDELPEELKMFELE